MKVIKAFDRKEKNPILLVALFGVILGLFSFDSLADPGFSVSPATGDKVEEAPQLPVESSDTSMVTITLPMTGIADQPPPASGGGSRAEAQTIPPPPPPTLPPVVEMPPPVISPPPAPVMNTGTVAPVAPPSTPQISVYGSAPQVSNGYTAPAQPSQFLQSGSNYQAPVQQTQPQPRRTIRLNTGYTPPAPPPSITTNQIDTVTQNQNAQAERQRLADEYTRIMNQSRALYDAGDRQGAERLIQTLPASEQGYARDYATRGGVTPVGISDEQAETLASVGVGIVAPELGTGKMFLTAREALKGVNGSVLKAFPKEYLDTTLGEILKISRTGNSAAKKAWKLLNDNRFKK